MDNGQDFSWARGQLEIHHSDVIVEIEHCLGLLESCGEGTKPCDIRNVQVNRWMPDDFNDLETRQTWFWSCMKTSK